MKKLFIGVVFSMFFLNCYALNVNMALKNFKSEIHYVKKSLEKGSLTSRKALVLLSAIRARQNEVLIIQNQLIIKKQIQFLQHKI